MKPFLIDGPIERQDQRPIGPLCSDEIWMLVRQWLVYFSGRDNDGVDLADLLKAQKLGAVCRAIASPPN
jgi:hypothetical protein